MRQILLKKHKINLKDYKFRTALEADYSRLITEDCTLIDEDTKQIIAIYFTMPETPTSLLMAILSIKYNRSNRTAGLVTNSRIFGWRPRERIRNNYCSSAALASSNPKEHAIIVEFAKTLTKYYKEFAPDIFKSHNKIAQEKIMTEWLIEDTPFSSGIINKNNELHYHHDAGNFKGVYSNMVAFKSNVKGGHLSMPEYDVGLRISTNSVLLFDGQKILHGVTSIKLLNAKAYRYTLVYYTLKAMWKCKDVNTELITYKNYRTEIENNRFKHLKGEVSYHTDGKGNVYRGKSKGKRTVLKKEGSRALRDGVTLKI